MSADVDENEDATLAKIARETKVVAMVGLSSNESRPSWGVARYLQSQGIRVIPVNPQHAGSEILGEPVYAALADIPNDAQVQMVDIFRRSEFVSEVVDDALQHIDGLQVIWMQLGITDEAAAARAEAQGVTVVQDRCPKIEFPRFI